MLIQQPMLQGFFLGGVCFFFFFFFQNTHPLNGSRAWDWILDVPVKPVLLAIDTYDDCCS